MDVLTSWSSQWLSRLLTFFVPGSLIHVRIEKRFLFRIYPCDTNDLLLSLNYIENHTLGHCWGIWINGIGVSFLFFFLRIITCLLRIQPDQVPWWPSLGLKPVLANGKMKLSVWLHASFGLFMDAAFRCVGFPQLMSCAPDGPCLFLMANFNIKMHTEPVYETSDFY